MQTQSVHKPVLLNEVIAHLTAPKIKGTPWYLDGTLGGAGHALAIASALKGKVNIVGMDRDPEAVKRAEASLAGKAEKVILECEDFRNLDRVLDRHKIGEISMMLFDLGLSSDELARSGRGFSFLRDEPLLMTFGQPEGYPFTARDIVNGWKEEDIANVIFAYGEEQYAKRIAKGIVEYRTKKLIETTDELKEIIRSNVPAASRFKKIHPATKTFQALRIAVNDELKAAEEGIRKGYERLQAGGRLAVISFHSMEDRIAKEQMRKYVKTGGILISKKPIVPTKEEVLDNPRARSAKLRVIEKHILHK